MLGFVMFDSIGMTREEFIKVYGQTEREIYEMINSRMHDRKLSLGDTAVLYAAFSQTIGLLMFFLAKKGMSKEHMKEFDKILGEMFEDRLHDSLEAVDDFVSKNR